MLVGELLRERNFARMSMIVSGIRSVVRTVPKSISYGSNAMGLGLLAHSSTAADGFLFRNVFKHVGEFFTENITPHFRSGLEWAGGHLEGSWVGSAGEWIGSTFKTIMSKEALNLPFLESLGMAASIPVGLFAGVGAALPIIGLGTKFVTNHIAKKAAAKVAAAHAAQAAAMAGNKIGGRTIAIAGGALAAGAVGATALSGGGGGAAVAEAGQNLSRVV